VLVQTFNHAQSISLLITYILAEEIAFEIVHFHTMTLDWVIQHTIMYHSSTSTYAPHLFQIGKKLFVDRQTDTEIDTDIYPVD